MVIVIFSLSKFMARKFNCVMYEELVTFCFHCCQLCVWGPWLTSKEIHSPVGCSSPLGSFLIRATLVFLLIVLEVGFCHLLFAYKWSADSVLWDSRSSATWFQTPFHLHLSLLPWVYVTIAHVLLSPTLLSCFIIPGFQMPASPGLLSRDLVGLI